MGRMASSRIALLVALVALIGAAVVSHHGTGEVDRTDKTKGVQAPLEYLPSVQSANLLSLGHKPALADLFWIRAVLYFHNEVMRYQQFTWLQQYTDLVSSLDPDFIDIYRWGGTVMVFSRQDEITYEDVARANAILEEGAKRFAEDYQLPMSAAANCTYYVKEPSEEEENALEECRRKFLAMAAERPGAPQYAVMLHVQATASKASESPEVRRQLCEFLKNTYMENSDQDVQAQIERRMKGGFCGESLSGEQLKLMREQFARIHNETYPFISPDSAIHVIDFARFAQSMDDPSP